MFTEKNASSGFRTRNIDTWHHFILKYIEDDIKKIVFDKKDENGSDLFTKKVRDN
jgi:hypothetical protein